MSDDRMLHWLARTCREQREEAGIDLPGVAAAAADARVNISSLAWFERGKGGLTVGIDAVIEAYTCALELEGDQVLWGRALAAWLEASNRGSAEWFIDALEGGALNIVDLIRSDLRSIRDAVQVGEQRLGFLTEAVESRMNELEERLERRSKYLIQIGATSKRLRTVERTINTISQQLSGARRMPLREALERPDDRHDVLLLEAGDP